MAPLIAATDLHLHLDGSLRRQTLEELLVDDGRVLATNFGFRAGMGLTAALDCFATTLSVMQSTARIERISNEVCEDAAADGVGVLEIRFAPQLHQCASVETVVDAALSGIAGRAGLILCGLYGDSPDLVAHLVRVAVTRHGVVGIDLAGAPSPDAPFQLRDYAEAFRAARTAGLGRTVHAAEGRDPSEIVDAIELLGADRIGHGTTLMQSPRALDLVLERNVVIEACPTSNVHTSAIPCIADHPIREWLAAGVRVCVNSDNTLMSATTAPEELGRLMAQAGLTADERARCIRTGVESRFVR